MNRKPALLVSLWILSVSFVLAQETVGDLEAKLGKNPNDVATIIQLGRLCQQKAAAGDKDAVEKGFTYFDKALQLEPSNAVALACRGSLWTMRGRDAVSPTEKMSNVDKGTDEMDKAVELAPDNVTVRLVRGINSIELPPIFNRLSVALKDFDHLLKSPAFSHYDAGLQCTIYCWAGIAVKRDDQPARAKDLLQKAVALGAGSPSAVRAHQELKDLQ